MDDIAKIVDRIMNLEPGEPLRNAVTDPTTRSSEADFNRTFYVKLGPMPAFPKGK